MEAFYENRGKDERAQSGGMAEIPDKRHRSVKRHFLITSGDAVASN